MTPDQMQEQERHAALMAVASALTEQEQAVFLAKVAATWPRMVGAKVADVLDMMDDHDMFVDQTDPFFELHGEEFPWADINPCAPRFALYVLILLDQRPTVGRVLVLLQRAGVTEAPKYPHVRAGLRIKAGTAASALLVFIRAEQGMRAHGVPEADITEFRRAVRVVGGARSLADIAAWVTLVDENTPVLGRPYDPTRDLAVVLAWTTMHGVDAPVRPAITNLREHLDLRTAESAEAGLRMFYGKEA
jgi:hypothetical protein